ncbi:MAG: aminotransferase class V-fold PLP-dependent enzyme [Verrucomicrobia bacterium]|nr:aminotransferase class V-fold PLP-dependent enzyme [Verrucomicrobiota bacterium]
MLTPQSRKEDFPSLEGIAYLNTAAESIPPRCVGEAVHTYLRDKQQGMKGREAHYATLEACREIGARFTGLQPQEIGFCSCSSEAYNLLATALDSNASEEVVITDLDFPAGATPWLRAARGPRVRLWQSVEGELRLSDLEPLLNPRTRLVQVSLVSFYNGFRIPWGRFRDCVRRCAPRAVLAVDVTQALGRIPIDSQDADVLVCSTHKWTLGLHGGCLVGVPAAGASALTTRAGGWFHLTNAFEADRFERAVAREGAASYGVGMPNFVALYALNASLRYLERTGVSAIEHHANPLTRRVHDGLVRRGLQPLAPWQPQSPSGIVAFRHPQSESIHAALEASKVHVMHHAGRIRVAVHGYNSEEDIERFLRGLDQAL